MVKAKIIPKVNDRYYCGDRTVALITRRWMRKNGLDAHFYKNPFKTNASDEYVVYARGLVIRKNAP